MLDVNQLTPNGCFQYEYYGIFTFKLTADSRLLIHMVDCL